MIAGITAYYAIGLKNVYDDMSDAPAAGFSLFMFMFVICLKTWALLKVCYFLFFHV